MADDILPLIVQNASEIVELSSVQGNDRNLMLVTHLNKLKRLEINCYEWDQRPTIALINELSLNNQLEMLRITHIEFNNEFSRVFIFTISISKWIDLFALKYMFIKVH